MWSGLFWPTFVEGRSHRKAWGLLFTCMSSRAVHVELMTSQTLSEFILAFTRFTDLRGPVSTIYSDNGTTFQVAAKVLPKLLESTELKNSLRKKGINWEFIPPYAPAQGGAWEHGSLCIEGPFLYCPSRLPLRWLIFNSARLTEGRPCHNIFTLFCVVIFCVLFIYVLRSLGFVFENKTFLLIVEDITVAYAILALFTCNESEILLLKL